MPREKQDFPTVPLVVTLEDSDSDSGSGSGSDDSNSTPTPTFRSTPSKTRKPKLSDDRRRERQRLRQRERRQKLYQLEKEKGYNPELDMVREKNRISAAKRRREQAEQLYMGPNHRPGETYGDYHRRISRERIQRERLNKLKDGSTNDENTQEATSKDAIPGETVQQYKNRLRRERFAKKKAAGALPCSELAMQNVPQQIKSLTERSIVTLTERKFESQLRPFYQKNNVKIIRRPENYEALEPEIAEEWCFKEFFVQDIKLKYDDERRRLCLEALEIELGPDIPDPVQPARESISIGRNWKTSNRWMVFNSITSSENDDPTTTSSAISTNDPLADNGNPSQQKSSAAAGRWNGLLEHDSGDADNNAIVEAFNNVQIEQEDEEGDKEVQDWIARVISGDAEEYEDEDTEVQIISEKSNAGSHRTSTRDAKNNAKKKITKIISSMESKTDFAFQNEAREKVTDIRSASNIEERVNRINYWKTRALQTMQNHKFDKLKEKLEKARNRWIAEKPDEDHLRAKVDEERRLLREQVISERNTVIELVWAELARKREIFSKETIEERTKRIQSRYEKEQHILTLPLPETGKAERVKKQIARRTALGRIKTGETLTVEERKAKIAEYARIRIKKEKQEYEMYNAFVTTLLDPSVTEIGKEQIEKFENMLVQNDNREAIEYWYKYQASRTEPVVIAYRRLLYDIMSARICVKDVEESPSTTEGEGNAAAKQIVEVISVPESKSLKDIEDFKKFLVTHGEIVKKHVTYKRFYIQNAVAKNTASLTPEQKELLRIKFNARFRRNYAKKKFGINLELGEYIKERDPTKRNSKHDSSEQGTKRKSKSANPPKPKVSKSLQKPREKICKPKKSPAPRKSTKKKKVTHLQQSSSDDDSENSMVEYPDPNLMPTSTSNSLYNNTNEYSNSGDGFPDAGEDDGSNEMWTPAGSFALDSVVRQELMNFGAGMNSHQYHPQQAALNFQNQTISTVRGMPNNMGLSSSAMDFQHQPGLYQMPQLQLVNPLSQGQGQWNSSAHQNMPLLTGEPLNYSLQFLPNSQLNILANVSSHQQQTPHQGWNSVPSASSTMPSMPILVPETPLHLYQNQTNNDQDYAPSTYESDNASSSTSSPQMSPLTPSKRPRGRPKGFKVQPKNRNLTMSQNVVQKAKRDIWNNRMRRKYYERFGRPENTLERRVYPSKPVESFPFEKIVENLNSTLSENIENLLPKCPQCDKIFDTDALFQFHMKKCHSTVAAVDAADAEVEPETTSKPEVRLTSQKMQCKSCFSTLTGPFNLIEHIFICHYDHKRYPCPYCRMQQNKSVYKYERNSLNNHIRKQHPKEADTTWVMGINAIKRTVNVKKFLCLHCSEVFDSYSKLTDHCNATHARIRYCCKFCGIYLREDDFWTEHIKLFHPDKNHPGTPQPLEVDERDRHRCDTCHSEFSSPEFLKEHINQGHTWIQDDDDTISKKKKIRCKACDQQFETVPNRDEHYKSCSSRGYFCYWCKSKFNSDGQRKKHVTKCHPQEPPAPATDENGDYNHEPYKCELCKRSYMSLYCLWLHAIRAHHLVKVLENLKAKGYSMGLAGSARATKSLFIPNQSSQDPKIVQGVDDLKQKQTEAVKAPTDQQTADMDKIYNCPHCPFSTSAADFHQVHRSYDRVMKRYCVQCDRFFSRSIVLHQHNEAAHNKLKDTWVNPPPIGQEGPPPPGINQTDWHSCSICLLGFTSEEFHRCHIASKNDTDIRSCPYCDKKFYQSPHYRDHLHIVHNVPLNTKMSIRKKAASTEKQHQQQMRGKTLQPEDYDKLSATSTVKTSTGEMTYYTCKSCLKNFKTQDFLRKHIEDTHKEDAFSRVACAECACTFSGIINLRRHERLHHGNNLTRFQCPLCPTMFLRRDHLRDHHNRKHDGQLFKPENIKIVPIAEAAKLLTDVWCKICALNFKNTEGLKAHMTNRHFPIHFSTFCEVCGLQINPKALKVHMQSQHPHAGPLSTKHGNTKDSLNLMDVVELVKGVYHQTGTDYHMKFSSLPKAGKSTGSSKPSNSRTRKRTRKGVCSDEEDFVASDDEEDASNCYIHSSSSSDDDELLFAANQDDSEDEGDNEVGRISLKDIIVKPKKLKKQDSDEEIIPRREQPSRTSRNSKRRSYAEKYDDDSDSDEDYIQSNPKRSKGQRQSASNSKNTPKKNSPSKGRKRQQKRTSSLQHCPKTLKIILERCDDQVMQMKSSRIVESTKNKEKKKSKNRNRKKKRHSRKKDKTALLTPKPEPIETPTLSAEGLVIKEEAVSDMEMPDNYDV